MLLPWISETMGLIPVDINSNFLRDFPLQVKRVVVSSVVRYFATQFDHAIKTIKTPSHLDFNMEIIGTFIVEFFCFCFCNNIVIYYSLLCMHLIPTCASMLTEFANTRIFFKFFFFYNFFKSCVMAT